MAVQELQKSEWRDFFDRVSKTLVGKRAEIEVIGLVVGDQIEVEWLPILGIAYDPKDDLIEISLDGLDHLIKKPQKVSVDLRAEGLTSMQVIDGDGLSQIVKLRDPLMLPPPSAD
jgi:hypothetical protein